MLLPQEIPPMNQARMVPELESEPPAWSTLERVERKEFKPFRAVPDFDQMLKDHANNKKCHSNPR